MLKEIAVSMRPIQWYKNLIIFAAIVFSLNLKSPAMWLDTILGFIIFCLLASSGYLINDVLDIQRDQSHPNKLNRPIASGRLKPLYAIIIAIILIAACLTGAYFVTREFFLISIAYILLSVSYSLFLKRLPIADVLAISCGFILRAAAGGFAIDLTPSGWFITCTFLLALYLSLGKRRHEMVLLGKKAGTHREAQKGYPLKILDPLMIAVIVVLIAAYSCYTQFTNYANNTYMAFTIPFVICGLIRYLRLVRMNTSGEEEFDLIFRDKLMLIFMSLWIASVIIILYVL